MHSGSLASIIVTSCLLVLCPACSHAPQPDSKKAAAVSSAPESEEDKTVLAVSEAIRTKHLAGQAAECLAYQFDGQSFKDDAFVEVRENHRNPKCGGDPATSPRLFSVRVSRATGAMYTDINSPGEFHLLPK